MLRSVLAVSVWLGLGIAVYAQQPPLLYNSQGHAPTATGAAKPSVLRPKPRAAQNGQSCKTIFYEGLPDKTAIPVFDGVTATGWVAGISEAEGGQAQFINAPSGDTVAVFLNGGTNTISFAHPVSSVQYAYATAYQTTLTAYDAANNVLATEVVPPNWDGNPNGYDVWSPIPQPLQATGNQIAKINLQSTATLNNFLGIDEFQFCTAINIDSVEITQAIQQIQPIADLKSTLAAEGEPPVPIIAGKPAALRVYVNTVYDVTPVNVTLSIPGVISETKLANLVPGCTPTQQRYFANGCLSTDFYFTPPTGSWTATVTLSDANTGNSIDSAVLPVTSRSTQPLKMRAVSVCDADNFVGLFTSCGYAFELVGKTTLLEKLAPTSSVSLSVTNHFVRRDMAPYCPDPSNNATCNSDGWWDDTVADVNRLYTNFDAAADITQNTHTTYFGLDRANLPGGTGGQAFNIPSHAAVARDSVPRFASNTETVLEVVAHETGHTLGLKHTLTNNPAVTAGPPGCYNFANDPSTDWPWKMGAFTPAGDNRIQSLNGLEVPFDVAARATMDPHVTYEVESYCSPRWIAPQRYKTEIAELNGGTVLSPSVAPGQGTPEPQVSSDARPLRPRAVATEPFWMVTGSIPVSGPAQFGPLFQSTISGDTSGGSGTYSLVVQNATGTALFTQQFTPSSPQTETSGTDHQGTPRFAQLVPVTANAARIVLMDPTNTVLGTITLGGVAPTVSITNPTAAFNGSGAITWTITDPDSSTFTSRVYYSPDNGTTWSELGEADDSGTSLNVDFTKLPGTGGHGLIQVLVSDGVNTGQATSPNFSISKKTPTIVQITAPTPNFFQPGTDPVLLSGIAYDVDDGVLGGASLAWTSNLQGALGTGSRIFVILSVGVHTITLTATDSDHNSISTTTTVTIAGQPPTIGTEFFQVTSPPQSASACYLAEVIASPGVNGAPVTAFQYSIDGGNTYTGIPLNQMPFTFMIPGVGFVDLVLTAKDASNQAFAASYSFFNNSACQSLIVPNVVGQTQAAATNTLNLAGLLVGTTTTAASGTVPSGSVISQSQTPGTAVPVGAPASVNLEISGGTQVAVPNVVGQTQAAASTAITGAGLLVGVVSNASSATVAAGNVISESPAAATLENAGTSVNLTVSTGAVLAVSAPSSLPNGTIGQVYAATTIAATGGSGNYTWSASGLPSGLTIAASTGVISGTPGTNAGSPFSVLVTVTDSTYSTTANHSYGLTIAPALSISLPASLPAATVGAAYSATVTATGGSGVYSWYAPALPAGMIIGTTTGAISGTPTGNTGSPYSVQVTVEDSNSAVADIVYTLTVNNAPLAISGPSSLSAASVGVAYSATVTATGGVGAYAWSASGLPGNLTINSGTGVISGTVTSSTGSPFSVTVTVKDANLTTVNKLYTLAASSFSKCDVNQDGNTNVVDVQRVINEALGISPAVDDLNQDGSVNVVDVQIVINAALGLGCSAR